MHSFQETRTLPYSASIINEIIMDIEKYPQFLPWCKSATILSTDNACIIAELTISFQGFSETYKSKVFAAKDKDNYLIETKGIQGSFKYLKNIWSIKQLNNYTKVNFLIDFELKSKMLDAIIGKAFFFVSKKLIAAFEDRAKKLSTGQV